MNRQLPVFDLQIDENIQSDSEVNFIALVDAPAIEKNFLAFTKDDKLKFAVQEDRRIISGAAMLAETPIYRRDNEHGEYYVKFSAATIYCIVEKFFSKGFNQNFNLFHDPNQKADGVVILESFITDSARGIQPMKGFEDAPEGSWFVSAKINNEEIWNRVKSGELKGFSVEGMFEYSKKPVDTAEATLKKIEEMLRDF